VPTAFAQRKLFALRALKNRCPQCAQGALFAGYARLHPACPSCGLVYRRESGAMTGSMYLSAVVTEIFAALLAVALFLATDWSTPVALSVGLVLVLAFSYFWLPRAIALWVATEYATDVANGESWTSPRP
jgi:uncharacterized protein (DUF983 family)